MYSKRKEFVAQMLILFYLSRPTTDTVNKNILTKLPPLLVYTYTIFHSYWTKLVWQARKTGYSEENSLFFKNQTVDIFTI